MNKTTVLVLTAALVLTSAAVFAQNPQAQNPQASPSPANAMMPAFPQGFKPPMMRTVLASSDGGVIVVTSDKIIKYDKDLNLVNKVDLKTD